MSTPLRLTGTVGIGRATSVPAVNTMSRVTPINLLHALSGRCMWLVIMVITLPRIKTSKILLAAARIVTTFRTGISLC